MDFSFIIPSYQQGRFLRDCLDSIAAQGLPPDSFEVWVMDGGSTDKTAQVASDHPLRPHFISEADGGQAHAVNKGIARASGRYIAWINSDDFYRPNVFPKILQYLYQNPDAAVVYGDGSIVDEAGRFLEPYPTEDWDYTRLAEKCFICQPSLVFRRDIIDEVGSLDEQLHLGLDLEFWMRCGHKHRFHRLGFTVACSRHYHGTKSDAYPLQMQVEALLSGHKHIGHWSRRRVWAIAEILLLRQHPQLKEKSTKSYLSFLRFWTGKSWRFARIVCRANLETYLRSLLRDQEFTKAN